MKETMLNDAQKQVVDHKSGEMLVVAGAGTGKTKTIVERIASLIADGVDKQSILALTFTEKAALEMLDRVGERLQQSYGVEMAIHTFNAFGQLLIQEFAADIGLSPDQKLVGEDGRVVFMREHLDELELDYFMPTSKPDGQLVALADYFSLAKQQLVTPKRYEEYAASLPDQEKADKLEKKKHIELARAYKNYTQLMRKNNIIDYDDQIFLAINILETRPNVLETLRKRYAHIMIDEFQDTNPMQSRLVDLIYGSYELKGNGNSSMKRSNSLTRVSSGELVSSEDRESQANRTVSTEKRDSQGIRAEIATRGGESLAQPVNSHPVERSLVVVGDDDQSIYEWRGATLTNILEFTTRYPNAKKVALATNYRSTQEILDSAWQLIQNNNPNRLEHIEHLNKKLIADKGSGHTPKVYEFTTQAYELAWVAEDIKQRVKAAKDSNKPASIAVLTRSRRLAREMHDMLELSNVNHVVAGLGEDLYKQPIVVMMLDALQAVWQPSSSDLALYHTLNSKLFSCDPVLLAEVAHDARSRRISLLTALSSHPDEVITQAVSKIEEWHTHIGSKGVRALSYQILDESGLKDTLYAQAREDAAMEKEVLTLSQWFSALQEFERITTTPSVYSYLENLSVLQAEGELLDDSLDIIDGIPVVMTMHKSKGLEWDTVYVIGANERSFPYLGGGASLKLPEELRITSEADSRLYEERRLMYVAATRARELLFITHSQKVAGGKTQRKSSRFIAELGLESALKSGDENGSNLERFNGIDKAHKIGLPRKLTDGENIVLSASQAENYLQCPLNFYYKHVLGVPDISGPEAAVGSLMHGILQTINEAKKSGRSIPIKVDLLAKIKQEWPEVGYETRKQRDNAMVRALESFDDLYERIVSEDFPIAVEESFRVRIPNSRLILHGRIDAVVPYDGGVEIHDYKTNTSVQDEDKAKSKVRSSDQLTMYAVAWRLLNGQKPDYVALDFIFTGHIGRMKKQDKSLDTMERKLAEIAEKIKSNEFEPGSNHDYCIHPI